MNAPAGRFDAAKAGAWRRFCPSKAYHRVGEIDLQELWDRGIRLLMLDVDNTLVEWRGEDFSSEVLEWLASAKRLGFHLCILSNTRHSERLARIGKALDVETVRARFKPSRRMYRMALEKFGVQAGQAVMIGDQILTDVLGANRSGVEAIWVHRISDREFVGTRFNRMVERLVLAFLRDAAPTLEAMDAITDPDAPFARVGPLSSKGVRQFLKFGVVGGMSFAIDFGAFWILRWHVGFGHGLLADALGGWLRGEFPALFAFARTNGDAAVPPMQTVASALAILNSFYWNRRWTFGIRDERDMRAQFTRFVVVSVMGLILNTLLVTVLGMWLIPADPKKSLLWAKLVATVIVAFWNFGGQKLWAFRGAQE